jgi:biopolymer transport protein TolQ
MVLNASVIVQLVMLLLLMTSIVSWAMIFRKWSFLKKASNHANDFEKRFWSGRDLNDLYDQISGGRRAITGMSAIFDAGFKEYMRLKQQSGIQQVAILEGSQRAMRVALNREIDDLEEHLSLLATVGSTSPYIGLFGTVWGIMNSFRSLGNIQQATIAHVAPGISEALVATAMGLFAAIPAVIAYNRFADEVERLESRYDTFLEEFSTILQRQVHG